MSYDGNELISIEEGEISLRIDHKFKIFDPMLLLFLIKFQTHHTIRCKLSVIAFGIPMEFPFI